MQYFVTAEVKSIPKCPVLIVDGTPPGWEPRPEDAHYDHHRPGGAPVQVEEMPLPFPLQQMGIEAIGTCQVDADAAVAAAAAQLLEEELSEAVIDRLTAIAWDCDHLCVVPPRLSHLSKFAAEAVASLKAASNPLAERLGLPENRKIWSGEDREAFASLAFQEGTEWLLAAARSQKPWPGEQGEASEYWAQVKSDSLQIVSQGRISYPSGIALIDMRGFFDAEATPRYTDPRAAIEVIDLSRMKFSATVTVREVWGGGEKLGLSYTIGCHPAHSGWKSLDYLSAGLFSLLSKKERSLLSKSENEALDLADTKWGGRATVGGSPHKHPSRLQPEEVVATVKQALGGCAP